MKTIYNKPEIEVVNLLDYIATIDDGNGGQHGANESMGSGGGYEEMPTEINSIESI